MGFDNGIPPLHLDSLGIKVSQNPVQVEHPLISIIYGSETDEEPMRKSGMFDVLQAVLAGRYRIDLISSDRHDKQLQEHVSFMVRQDVAGFICIAGLLNILASRTANLIDFSRPVIGVVHEVQDLVSFYQKPKGAPILTTGYGARGLYNAALAACQIAAFRSDTIQARFEAFRKVEAEKKRSKLNIDPEFFAKKEEKP